MRTTGSLLVLCMLTLFLAAALYVTLHLSRARLTPLVARRVLAIDNNGEVVEILRYEYRGEGGKR